MTTAELNPRPTRPGLTTGHPDLAQPRTDQVLAVVQLDQDHPRASGTGLGPAAIRPTHEPTRSGPVTRRPRQGPTPDQPDVGQPGRPDAPPSRIDQPQVSRGPSGCGLPADRPGAEP